MSQNSNDNIGQLNDLDRYHQETAGGTPREPIAPATPFAIPPIVISGKNYYTELDVRTMILHIIEQKDAELRLTQMAHGRTLLTLQRALDLLEETKNALEKLAKS